MNRTLSMLALGLLSLPLRAGVVEVELTLPLPARLDLRDLSTVAVAPFLMFRQDGEEEIEHQGVDVQHEFDSYLRRLLRRNTKLKVVEMGPVDFPSFNISDLAEDSDFWRYLGERTQADLILAGALDFDILELRGYRTEPVIVQGMVYSRQVLVERAGFEFDVVMLVIDGGNGGLLFADNFKDFREFDKARVDPLVGMFENLNALEGRIVGIFTSRWLRTPRSLFTD